MKDKIMIFNYIYFNLKFQIDLDVLIDYHRIFYDKNTHNLYYVAGSFFNKS